MKISLAILCSVVIGVANTTAVAQQQNVTPKHLMREDSAAVHALVMYPDTIRLDIFEACEYPAAIVSIASLQKTSSTDFVNLISGYSKDEQEDLWNLTRYPGLIAKLAEGSEKSTDQIHDILIDYPAEIHEAALKYGTKHYDLLQKMDEIQSQTDAQFEQVIADYPAETQDALRDLVRFPEIISLLNDHLSLTVRVGDRFRRNPRGVIHRADSLNLVETRQNAEDAEAWKQTIEQNPDAATDLQNAASDYATENGYTQDEVNASPNPDDVSNYTCNPYSYWFGYPTWYPYSYWYPYPFWFDCGFYHGRSGKIVMIGSPSYYFTNWYFYHPEHWHHYPHLCDAYINHYYEPRRLVGANTIIVHNWVRENRNYLPKDFISNNSRRSLVIRQVGQLHMDVRKHQGAKPVSPEGRDQYFRNNMSRYPALNADQKKIAKPPTRNADQVIRTEEQDKRYIIPDIIQPPVKQPPARIGTRVERPPVRVATPVQPPVKIATPEQPRPTTPRPTPSYNFNQINKAQEYHRDVWDQTHPSVRPQPQPPPRSKVQQPERQNPVNRKPLEKRK